LAPVGFGLVSLLYYNDASSFLIVYGVAAYYFSLRMVRLILLTAPIASVLGGIAVGHVVAWSVGAILDVRPSLEGMLELFMTTNTNTNSPAALTTTTKKEQQQQQEEGDDKKKSKNKKSSGKKDDVAEATVISTPAKMDPLYVKLIRLVAVYYLYHWAKPQAETFRDKCNQLSHALSHPTIIQKGRLQSGQEVLVDDYREAYWWLRDNTPEDARVMAWWDYGYQIAGIANRTTIADGNTWNHEHIALLGRALTSSVKEGHRIARHLADYVLIWAGGGGDDLAKSPHMRRIANSVYRFLCPGDPTCRSFGVSQRGLPTKSMENSMLFSLHGHGIHAGVEADKNRFKLVFESKHGKVRVFKVLSVSMESKRWVADPANRICDAPGSWFCRGQYPPALQKILREKKDFKQLEDFNVKGDDDSEYTKQYLENLNNPEKAQRDAMRAERKETKDSGSSSSAKKKKPRIKKIPLDEIELMNNPEAWGNNAMTTAAWQIIHENDIRGFRDLLLERPEAAHVRSEDGRGPIWWAHEYGRSEMVKLLLKLGVSEDLRDVNGVKPTDLSNNNNNNNN